MKRTRLKWQLLPRGWIGSEAHLLTLTCQSLYMDVSKDKKKKKKKFIAPMQIIAAPLLRLRTWNSSFFSSSTKDKNKIKIQSRNRVAGKSWRMFGFSSLRTKYFGKISDLLLFVRAKNISYCFVLKSLSRNDGNSATWRAWSCSLLAILSNG